MTGWMTASEAMSALGVKRRTLYTYASRGWIGTRPLDGRSKLYRRSDVDRLRERASTHRSRQTLAREALSWGEPVLTTRVSGIDRDGPYYRGVPALDLMDCTLHDVAELLWGTSVTWPEVLCARTVETIDDLRRAVDGLPRRPDPLQQAAQIATHVQCWAGLPSHPDLQAAQILCAEHGLNASTFTARVVASTGADLYAVVVAALAAFSGPRHGTASIELAALLANPARLRSAILNGQVPGFEHPLYPDGDPRGAALLERCPPQGALQQAVSSCEVLSLHPNLDAGLLAVCESHDLPPSTAPMLFAAGRTLGWLAHALEQRETPGLLRPRGRFAEWTA